MLYAIATGETVAEVEREKQDAVRFHFDGMREDGMTPPEPTAIVGGRGLSHR